MGTLLLILILVLLFNVFSYKFPEEVISYKERVLVTHNRNKESVFNSEDASSFNERVLYLKRQSMLRIQVISTITIILVLTVIYQFLKDLV